MKMNVILKKINWFNQAYLFFGVLFINIYILFSIDLYPSSDGAAHLYNSNLIFHLFKGDSDLISTFFKFNSFPVPNWIDHLIIALFRFVLPAWQAEKAFLLIYLLGLTLSFRCLVRALNPDCSALSVLIFPFVYSYLFRMGFYNNSFSFLLLFFTLYYWVKTKSESGFKKYFYLFILVSLTYFSNGLTFLFLGLALGVFITATAVSDYYQKTATSFQYKKYLKDLLLLLCATLPCCVLFILFTRHSGLSPFISEQIYQRTFEELFYWIVDAKPLIAYNPDREGDFSRVMNYILISVIVASIASRIAADRGKHKAFWSKFRFSDCILVLALFALLLFFIIPDEQGAGMMSDRYCLLFFMFIILWAALQKIPNWLSPILVLALLFSHFSLLSFQMNSVITPFSRDALRISKAADYVNPNSVVFTIDFTGNWLQGHYGDYIGIQKPIVIMDSYEATMSWFPLRWNREKMPQVEFGGKAYVTGLFWESNLKSPIKKQMDYILLMGDISKLKEPQCSQINEVLSKEYKLIYSADLYVYLFQKKVGHKS